MMPEIQVSEQDLNSLGMKLDQLDLSDQERAILKTTLELAQKGSEVITQEAGQTRGQPLDDVSGFAIRVPRPPSSQTFPDSPASENLARIFHPGGGMHIPGEDIDLGGWTIKWTG